MSLGLLTSRCQQSSGQAPVLQLQWEVTALSYPHLLHCLCSSTCSWHSVAPLQVLCRSKRPLQPHWIGLHSSLIAEYLTLLLALVCLNGQSTLFNDMVCPMNADATICTLTYGIDQCCFILEAAISGSMSRPKARQPAGIGFMTCRRRKQVSSSRTGHRISQTRLGMADCAPPVGCHATPAGCPGLLGYFLSHCISSGMTLPHYNSPTSTPCILKTPTDQVPNVVSYSFTCDVVTESLAQA